MHLILILFVCVSNTFAVKLYGSRNHMGSVALRQLIPNNDVASFVDMFSEADPDRVEAIIDLLESLKNDSESTEYALESEVNRAVGERQDAKNDWDEAIVARDESEIAYQDAKNNYQNRIAVEQDAENLHKAAVHDEQEANNTYNYQIEILNHDQDTIVEIIELLRTIMNTNAPTNSPTSAPTSPTTAPTTPPTTVPPFADDGKCFQDRHDRDLPEYIGSKPQNAEGGSINYCKTGCKGRGFTYAGVQAGVQCFCGNSYGRHGGSNGCNLPCDDGTGDICGGSWAYNVYRAIP